MATNNICSTCGQPQPSTASYCSHCGNPLPGLGTGRLSPNSILQGRYIIVKKLGQGGMGAVYQAADQRITGRLWAIKEMSMSLLNTPAAQAQAVQGFQQEASMLARLDHPNLPKVSDFFQEGGRYYLVMDFIEGETLEEKLDRRGRQPFPERQALDWVEQLCDVLSYLHNQNPPVIFRDLKPGNIMVAPDGVVKLIDFGIARHFKPGQTRDTQRFGTSGYSPPEQHGRGQTDARSDIYSLGVVLYEALTGHDPTTTPFSLPKARQLNLAVSPHVEQIIERATQDRPEDRFQSVAEMRRELMSGGSPPPPPLPPTQPAGQASGGLPGWAVAAGGILGALIVLTLGIAVAYAVINGMQPTVALPPPPSSTPIIATATDTIATRETPPTEGPSEKDTPTTSPRETFTPTWTPSPRPPTHTPTPDWSAYRSAIRSVVREYGEEIKVDATTHLDPSRLGTVLTDPVLERQQRSVCWLRNEELYYTYSNRSFEIDEIRFQDDHHATLLARISENRVLRKRNGSAHTNYGQEEYRAIYQLKRSGRNSWYIYCFQALDEDDPLRCEVKLEGPDPCER